MGKFWNSIPDNLRDWALQQQVFFTASAPLHGKHINVSPKGLPSATFSIFDSNHAAYVDGTGSGGETVSHLYENGRITIMFCSFLTTPRILRFFCTGKVVEFDQPQFEPLIRKMGMEKITGARAVILLEVFQVQTSCGYGVPLLTPVPNSENLDSPGALKQEFKDRETMGHWASKKVEKDELHAYQAEFNARSLDGLTGLRAARRNAGERLWLTETKAHIRRVAVQREALFLGIGIGILLMVIFEKIQAMQK